jgi:NitT/TauT family transport system permease protein
MNETTINEANETLSAVFEEFDVQRREQAKKESRKKLIRGLVSIAGGLVIWHIMSHTIMIHVPDPIETARGSFWAVQQTYFYKSVIFSLYRVYTGFILGCLVGIPLGLMMGWNKVVRDFTFPPFETLRPMPPVSWVPLAILMFVKMELSIIFLPFLGTFFVVTLNAKLGAESVDESMFRAANCLGANSVQVFRHVVLPGSLPYIFTGLALGMGMAWITIVAAEMISGTYGIGYMCWQSYNLIRYPEVILSMVTIGVLGYGSSSIIRKLADKYLAWRQVYTA